VLCSARPDQVRERAEHAGVPARVIGKAGGASLVVEGLLDLSVREVTESWRRALPAALGEPV
jgi:hypothetical protein